MTISANFPNVKPSLLLDFANAQQLPPTVTFTRATTATYYNGSTTALAEQNLFLWSQAFDTAPWSGSGFTITANATTAPDGTTTAESFVPDTNSVANHQLAQNLIASANTIYTVSIYAKAFGYTKFAFRESVATGAYATFDLASSGSVISTGNVGAITVLGATITSVGSSWFRATVTFSSTVASTYGMGFFSLNNTYTSGDPYNAGVTTGNGTDGIYIWGGQVEQRPAASVYTATTTAAITNYNPLLLTAGGGQPRFDHNPTTSESFGLLFELQKTNLFTYSTTFDSSAWLANNATLRAGIPELNIYTIIPSTGNTTHQFYDQVGKTVTAQSYTISLNGKAYGYTKFKIADVSTGNGCWFDVSAGTVGTANSGYVGSIVALGNGFYRCSVTFTASAGTVYYGIYVGNTTETGTYAGNGFSGLYISSPQFEAGAFPSSYIPTVTAAATRASDAALMSGSNFSSWYNLSEGTFYTEVSFAVASYNVSNTYHFECSDGTSNNRLLGYTGGSVASLFITPYGQSGAVSIATAAAPSVNVSYRCGFFLETNNFAVTASAVAPQTDNSGLMPAVNRINIGSNFSSTEQLNGWIKKLAYYPQAVTSAQLQALTS